MIDLHAEGVHLILLGTRDAHEVYSRVGFLPTRDGHYMESRTVDGVGTAGSVDAADERR